MKSDIEIARSVNPMNIMDVAKKIGIVIILYLMVNIRLRYL